VIGKNLAKISIPELAVTAGELATLRDQAVSDVAQLETDLAKLPTMDVFFKLQADAQATVKAWEARQKAAEDLSGAIGKKAQFETSLTKISEECTRHDADLQALDDASRGQEQAITAARTALGHWQSYKNVARLQERLQEQRAYIATLRAKNPEPPKPAGETAEQVYRQMENIERQVKEAEKFVKLFTAEGTAQCPTCHTPTSNLTAQVKEQHDILTTLNGQLILLDASWMEKRAAEQAHADWRKKEDELVNQEKRLDDSERDLTTVTPPELSEDDLAKTVADYDSFQQARKEILPLAAAARLRKAQLEGSLTNLAETIEQLNAQIHSATVSAADAHLAGTQLKNLREQLANRAEIEQKRSGAQYRLKDLDAQFITAQQNERAASTLRSWSETAERVRDALKNAPRMVAQRNLQRLEVSINELLRIFQVNFQVKVAEDGTPTFIAEFYDGRRQVAQRLSIGQKTVLALAFRVAVNAMFAEEIGLLALDEPTASLDQPRIQALAPVLEKLRELSTAKGLQCLLVTHATTLSNLFESAIELEPPELRHVTPG
jgi:energy-coupling factor transporter ATP-binding protein EcfA2